MVVAASVYGLRIADADLWGHLSAGRLFLERREVPTADPFSYTAGDREWIAHEYLAEIVLYAAYTLGGGLALVALKCVLGGATAWLVYRSLRVATDDPRIWAPMLMLATLQLRPYLYDRPQLFTFALFALFVLVLFRRLVRGEGRIWLLPPSLALWANLHGGFVAGLGAIGLALATSALRRSPGETSRLALVLAASLVASLATPFGWKLWPSIWTDLTNPHSLRFIAEWQPLPLWPPDATSGLAIFGFALVTIAAIAAARRGACPADLPPWLWWLGVVPVAAMAWRHHRHVPLFAILAAPIAAFVGSAALERSAAGRVRSATLLALTSVIGLVGAVQVLDVLQDPLPRIRRIDARLADPARAIDFLLVHSLGGNVYTPLWWGSYVTWMLHPQVRVSCDGRNDMLYSVEQIGENLQFFATKQPDLEAPLRSASDFVLTPARAPVASRLRADRRWRLLYEDGDALVFALSEPASAP